MVLRNRWGMQHEDQVLSDEHFVYPVDDMEKLHDRFMEEIDEAFPLVDIVLADSAQYRKMVVDNTPRVSVVAHEGDKLYVELRENFFVPFRYERVCDATWRAITTEYGRQQRIIEEYCRTDDEFSSKFFLQSCAPGSSMPLRSAMVMRRFTEAHRTVLVWRSLNWDDTPFAKREYGDDTGWLIVERSVDPVSGEPNNDGAIVRVCTRYLPIWEDRTKLLQDGARLDLLQTGGIGSVQRFEAGGFMKRILNDTEEDIASITESVGNILLDESIGSSEDGLDSTWGEIDSLRNNQH